MLQPSYGASAKGDGGRESAVLNVSINAATAQARYILDFIQPHNTGGLFRFFGHIFGSCCAC